MSTLSSSLSGYQLSAEKWISHTALLKEKLDWVNLSTKRMLPSVVLTDVRKEDEGDLANLASAFRTNFNENQKLRK
jgi:hypothetical protein